MINQEHDANDQRESIFAAVEKLGLTLKKTKVAVDIMVIDHIEQTPTEN